MPVFRAREPFAFTDVNGVPRSVVAGDLYDGDDPNLRGKLHLFEPVETAAFRAAGGVEDASAEPGSRRSVSTRGRRIRGAKDHAEEKPPETQAEATEAVADAQTAATEES